MTTYEYIQIGILLIIFMTCWLGGKFIAYLRSKRHNRELWGTIFEGVTNKLIDLEAIKEPEVFIEKKTKQGGQSDDENKNQNEPNKTSSQK